MTYSMDGLETSSFAMPGDNVPARVKIPSQLSRLRDSLAKIAFDSKTCLETRGWTEKAQGKPINVFLSRNRWPDIKREFGKVIEILKDTELFDAMKIELFDRYYDTNIELFEKLLNELCEQVESGSLDLDDIDPAEIDSLEVDSPAYLEAMDRVQQFCDDYIARFNSLARFLQNEKPSSFPWITPVRPTIVIHSPYL